MDHDFVCISKQSDDEFTQLYFKGLEGYLGTDWIGAQMAFQMCIDKVGQADGPTNHFIRLMEKSKAQAPEDWNGAYDWDKKPVPPELDIFGGQDEDNSDLSGDE